jgi:DNA-binding transcriptional regulator YiaG
MTIKQDFRILTILIKNVPHNDSGAYGITIPFHVLAQCEKLAVEKIIENNFDFTDKEIHLFRSILKMSLKDFGLAFGVSDAAVAKWEKSGSNIPLGQKALIKAFMRQKLGLNPVKYEKLKEFNIPVLIETEYTDKEIILENVNIAC